VSKDRPELTSKPDTNNINKTPESLTKPKQQTALKQPALIKHLNVTTQVDKPFHRRQCYLNSHRPDHFRTAKLPMSKTIQLLNKDLLQRPSSERTYTTETINLADDDTPRDLTSNEEENELEVATTKSRQKEVKSSCANCVTKTRRRRYKKKKRQQQRQSAFMSEEDEDEDEEGGNESDMSNEVFLNKKSVIEYFARFLL